MSKPRIAFGWLASCGGCEEAVLDLNETLLFDVAPQVEIVFWPVAIDAKLHHLEAIEPQGILACFLNGSVRTREMAEMARLLRSKARILFAFGSCAHLGGIPSLANTTTTRDLLETAYRSAPSNAGRNKHLPGGAGRVPPLTAWAHPLKDLVEVDYFLPGCPPPPALVAEAFLALLAGKLPPRGHVFGEEQALCSSCSRLPKKPEDLTIGRLRRVYEVEAPADECLLAQGLLCLGPATRGGCGERCLKANMPCRGCFGPPADVADQGAAMLTFLAAHAPVDSGEQAVLQFTESLVDPVGTCYRFGLSPAVAGCYRESSKTGRTRARRG